MHGSKKFMPKRKLNQKRVSGKRSKSNESKHSFQLHIPGYNYCGPGTVDFSKKPVNKLDSLCRQHDLDYQEILESGENPYTTYNWADAKFERAVRKLRGEQRGFASKLVETTFRAKREILAGDEKMEEPHKKLTLKVNESISERSESDQKLTSAMPRTKRNSKGRRTGRKGSRRVSVRSSGRSSGTASRGVRRRAKSTNGRGNSSIKTLKKVIAKSLSPPLSSQEQISYAHAIGASSYWYCPTMLVSAGPTYTDISPFGAVGAMRAIGNVSTATTVPEMYFNYRSIVHRITNHSNSTMHVTCYKLFLKRAIGAVGMYLLDATNLIDTTIYTGDAGNTQFNFVSDFTGTSSKIFSPSEIPGVHSKFKFVTKKYKLEPGETCVIKHSSKKSHLFRKSDYEQEQGWTDYQFVKGDMAMLIRIDSELQLDHTLPNGVSYTVQSAATETTVSSSMRKKAVLQPIVYEKVSTTYLGTDPHIIDQTMTDQTDIN